MKILIIASASFAPFFLSNSPGDVIDMPEEISNDLIAAGCAQEFVEESSEVLEEQAPEKEVQEPAKEEEQAPEPSAEATTKKTTKK